METSIQSDLVEHFRLHEQEDHMAVRDRYQQKWNRLEVLGSGAYGIVYLEKNNRDASTRAVKQVRKLKGFDHRKELIALTYLSKPSYKEYFIQFLGWYEDIKTVSFVMEHFELGDLSMNLPGPLQEVDARDIASQILLGLVVMHRDGFIHRDLKPSNILVAQKVPCWKIKIGDFGVSKRIRNDTRLETQVGTKNYMAPEVLEIEDEIDSPPYTNAVDLWAVGLILFEILCGQRPFANRQILKSYCRHEVSFPAHMLLQYKITTAAISVITSLLQPLPLDRLSANDALKTIWFSQDVSFLHDVEKKDTSQVWIRDRYSELRLAILKGDVTMVHQLYTIGQDLGVRDSNGDTLMHVAAQSGHVAMVDHLRELGLDIGAKNDDGDTPIHRAAQCGQIAMVDRLRKLGQDIGVKNNNGTTPLHRAARNGQITMVEYLLRQNIEVNNNSKIVRTHLALWNGETDDPSKLTILSATYGGVESTTLAKILLYDGENLEIPAVQPGFPDPWQGIVKTMSVLHAFGDEKRIFICTEDSGSHSLKVGSIDSSEDKRHVCNLIRPLVKSANAKAHILAIVWGKAEVRSQSAYNYAYKCLGSNLPIEWKNAHFGPDNWPNHKKSGAIYYTYDGNEIKQVCGKELESSSWS